MADEIDVLTKDKLRKLGEIKEKGINPYPYNYKVESNTASLKKKYASLKEEEHSGDKTSVAGRVIALRRMGKASFVSIQDESNKMQLYFRLDDVGKDEYKFLKKLDIGDIVGAFGEVFKTRTGEVTIAVENYELLTKSIKPMPEKHHGLKDKELRYRKRYLDLIANPEVKEIFKKRSAIIKAVRDFFDSKNFMEVETPLLQTQYGGASARPFKTHINAWDMEMFLSVSPELYLKRLIVGGFEKVFTICKNFRNEGVDHSHNPEFTMIEIYEAYSDYKDMMKLIEECFEFVCLKVNSSTKVKHMFKGEEVEIDFKAPWPRMTTIEAIKANCNIDVSDMSVEELSNYCTSNDVELPNEKTWGYFVEAIYESKVEDAIIQPTHVYDRPKEGTPLCKGHREDSRLNEQCEPVGLGMEIGNMYSELNDPIKQKELLLKQVERGRGGDEESHPMDEDFLNALEIGMPPTGGIGWGIDRMVILLTGIESIRDCILFPTMKPEVKVEEKKKK